MITVAKIRENDDEKGRVIHIGYRRYTDKYGGKGYQICASNGDDVGYYAAKPKDECIAEIYAMYSAWQTFEND